MMDSPAPTRKRTPETPQSTNKENLNSSLTDVDWLHTLGAEGHECLQEKGGNVLPHFLATVHWNDGPELSYPPNACSTSSCCSYLWLAALPVAGLALSGRLAQLKACFSATSLGQRACREYQAPMLNGTSWTQITGVPGW